jgi:hypothetical protein
MGRAAPVLAVRAPAPALAVDRPGDDPVVAVVSAVRPLLVKWAIDDDIATGDAIGLRFTAMLFLIAVMAEFFASAVQV